MHIQRKCSVNILKQKISQRLVQPGLETADTVWCNQVIAQAISNTNSSQVDEAPETFETRERISNFTCVTSCARNRSQQEHLSCFDTILSIKNSPTLQQVSSKKPASDRVQIYSLHSPPEWKITKPFKFLGPTSLYRL